MFLFIKLLLGFGVTSCFKISRRFFSGFDQGKIEGSWSRHTLSPPGKCCPQIFVFGENSLRLSFLIRLLYSASTLDLVAVNGTSVLANFSNYLNILGRNSCVYPSLSEIVPQNDPRTTSLPDSLWISESEILSFVMQKRAHVTWRCSAYSLVCQDGIFLRQNRLRRKLKWAKRPWTTYFNFVKYICWNLLFRPCFLSY